MANATSAVSPLRRRMIDDMTLRNLPPATQRSYLHAVAKFSRYFDRSPDQLGLEDVRAFQVYLVAQGISWPAPNQTVCALRFFYGVTLNRAEIPERIAYAGTPRKLPTILTQAASASDMRLTAVQPQTGEKRPDRFVQIAENPHLRASAAPVRSMRHPPSGPSATLDTLRAIRYFDPQACSGDIRDG